MKDECISCHSTENLIEAGGQFSGGMWWLCKKCDDEAEAFTAFTKSDVWLEQVKKSLKEKNGPS